MRTGVIHSMLVMILMLIGDATKAHAGKCPRSDSTNAVRKWQIDLQLGLARKSRSLPSQRLTTLKEKSMRKSMIQLLVTVALLVGSLVPVYAATSPLPTPPLPPCTSN